MGTKIEWADRVWNPTTGCTKISDGCRSCYAERIAKRFWGNRRFADVQCHPERLEEPLHWKKPQRIFVNSMSDLFHDDIPLEFLTDVFAIMAKAQNHTFMILTKRPERMRDIISGRLSDQFVQVFRQKYNHHNPVCILGKNVWLGVTAENQDAADARIPILLNTPAAVRFVSVEPMLSPMFFPAQWMDYGRYGQYDMPTLDWVICGPETGPGARPMKREWIETLYEQCLSAKVPFFDKKNVLGLNLHEFPEATNAPR